MPEIRWKVTNEDMAEYRRIVKEGRSFTSVNDMGRFALQQYLNRNKARLVERDRKRDEKTRRGTAADITEGGTTCTEKP